MTDRPASEDLQATAIRAMAQHVVIAALVRTHPDPQLLRDFVEQFAEAHRAILLASTWPDAQREIFEHALDRLVGTLPPPSARLPR